MCCLLNVSCKSKTPTEVAIPDKNNAGPADLAEQMNGEFPEVTSIGLIPKHPSQTEYRVYPVIKPLPIFFSNTE